MKFHNGSTSIFEVLWGFHNGYWGSAMVHGSMRGTYEVHNGFARGLWWFHKRSAVVLQKVHVRSAMVPWGPQKYSSARRPWDVCKRYAMDLWEVHNGSMINTWDVCELCNGFMRGPQWLHKVHDSCRRGLWYFHEMSVRGTWQTCHGSVMIPQQVHNRCVRSLSFFYERI